MIWGNLTLTALSQAQLVEYAGYWNPSLVMAIKTMLGVSVLNEVRVDSLIFDDGYSVQGLRFIKSGGAGFQMLAIVNGSPCLLVAAEKIGMTGLRGEFAFDCFRSEAAAFGLVKELRKLGVLEVSARVQFETVINEFRPILIRKKYFVLSELKAAEKYKALAAAKKADYVLIQTIRTLSEYEIRVLQHIDNWVIDTTNRHAALLAEYLTF